MIDGALVLPLMIFGMTLASATRRFRHPHHPQPRIDDVADPAGAGVVIDRQREMQRDILQQRIARLRRRSCIHAFPPRNGGISTGPILRFPGQCAAISSARRITATMTFMSCGSS